MLISFLLLECEKVVRSGSLSRNLLPDRYDGWELITSTIGRNLYHSFFRGMEQPRAGRGVLSIGNLPL